VTDDQRGPDVGSVGEEAAKLFGALSGWAREQAAADPSAATGAATAAESAVHGLTDALGHLVGNVNEHVATGSEECRYCPVCQVIHAVRDNPEVRQQLSTAASSLLHAASALLATQAPGSRPPGVEKIDLSDDGDWDDER
jgi:hypothetical protein